MKRLLLWILILGLFVGSLWTSMSFIDGNAAPIDLDLVWVRFAGVALWRVILIAVGVGALLAALVLGFAWIRIRLLNRRYRKAIRRLEAELHEMRSLPLTGSQAELRELAAPEPVAEHG